MMLCRLEFIFALNYSRVDPNVLYNGSTGTVASDSRSMHVLLVKLSFDREPL